VSVQQVEETSKLLEVWTVESETMRKVSILNFKGGTGKTSLATNVAHALALRGQRVLLVDCDLQANSSSLLQERRDPTLTHVLRGEASFQDAIQPARARLDIVPSDRDLNTAASHIVATGVRAYNILKSATRSLTTYDFLFFDHSPSYSAVTETALLASEEILIPCELAPYAVTGLLEMISKLTETLQGLDHEIDIQGIVPFKLDQRYAMTEMYLTSLRKRFGDLVVPSVRTDATISRAQSLSQTVFEYDPRSKAVEDFTALASLLLQGKRGQL
jgi:chromosome partitioning protein